MQQRKLAGHLWGILLVPYIPPNKLRRRYPELADIHARHIRLAYRIIIIGYQRNTGIGRIVLTPDTFDEAWDSVYIRNHYRFYRWVDTDKCRADCLCDLRRVGIYETSNLVAIVHSRVSYAGRVIVEPLNTCLRRT